MQAEELLSQETLCQICGSSNLKKYTAPAVDASKDSRVNVIECNNCLFAWQHPWGRSEDESVDFFDQSYATGNDQDTNYFSPGLKQDIARLELQFINDLPENDKTLLDIGAGAGIFAEIAAADGWNVTAIDPAMKLGNANQNANLRKLRGELNQLEDSEHYDVVTLWDVIEHAPAPLELLGQAYRRVRSGGYIVVETGNFKSADRIASGNRHWIYQLDHKWYFSPRSMKQILEQTGFSRFDFADRVLRPSWNGTNGHQGPSILRTIKKILKSPLRTASYIDIHRKLGRLNSGDMPDFGIFCVAARKQS